MTNRHLVGLKMIAYNKYLKSVQDRVFSLAFSCPSAKKNLYTWMNKIKKFKLLLGTAKQLYCATDFTNCQWFFTIYCLTLLTLLMFLQFQIQVTLTNCYWLRPALLKESRTYRKIWEEIMDKNKTKIETMKKTKKITKKNTPVDELTDEEREAVTIVFHQFETGLREGTIFTKVICCCSIQSWVQAWIV